MIAVLQGKSPYAPLDPVSVLKLQAQRPEFLKICFIKKLIVVLNTHVNLMQFYWIINTRTMYDLLQFLLKGYILNDVSNVNDSDTC